MIGPRQPVDFQTVNDQTYEALLNNDLDQAYLGARRIWACPEPEKVASVYLFGRQLAYVPTHRLHGYDLLYLCAMAGQDPQKADEADYYAKATLQAHLLRPGETPLETLADRKAFRQLHNFVNDLCEYETNWDGSRFLFASPLDGSDALIVRGNNWFDEKGHALPVVKQVNRRLAEASTFLAVNGAGDEANFDSQPLFLWGRLMRMAIQQNKEAAHDLALDAMMIAREGCLPVALAKDPQGARIGRDRAAIRATSGACLFQAARGLVLTL